MPLPRPYPSYYYSRYYDWPGYSRYYYDDYWRYGSAYSSYLDWKYDPALYPYSRYYPWYSRYYSPYPAETKTVSYDVEKPTPYSPARTVKRETYHSPVYGSRTYTTML